MIFPKMQRRSFLQQIFDLVEENNISASLIQSFEKTPLKCAPVASETLKKPGSKHVAISEMTHQKSLTATFCITFSNRFLPLELLYGGKTIHSIHNFFKKAFFFPEHQLS